MIKESTDELFKKVIKCKDINELYNTDNISNDNLSNEINYNLKLDASKLFNYNIKLHELIRNTKDDYVLADMLDYNVCYGGNLLASNFTYFGLNQLYSQKITTNDLLLAKINYKSVKLHILRILHHINNLRFVNKTRIFKFSIIDLLPNNIIENKQEIKNQLTEATLSECFNT